MNPIKWILNWLGAGSPKKQNVTDYSKAMPIGKAMDLAKQGFKVRRAGDGFRYIKYADGNFWKCVQYDSVLTEYFPLDFDTVDKADYVSCDWYIVK